MAVNPDRPRTGADRIDAGQRVRGTALEEWRIDLCREPTMDLPTQAHLKTIRDLLTYRLADLRADVHAAEQERQQAGVGAGADVADRKDEAMRGQLSTLSGQQEERDREEMHQVEAALRRLDAGTYGDCEECAEAIPLRRLLVQPAAARCADCQAKFEYRLARVA